MPSEPMPDREQQKSAAGSDHCARTGRAPAQATYFTRTAVAPGCAVTCRELSRRVATTARPQAAAPHPAAETCRAAPCREGVTVSEADACDDADAYG
eukprot:CAMPEP_0119090552 /NCGR_PEP_ID=MMETSP1178-20130426/153114_1 /TAXON_ID=33656 /ORGANISM="unid sp, Strain CCMP2000" /LENGTH=96 /DNA_ID=CAMNT_0007073993 /DNA_START=237 /DNA_END=529 /DNA_ORIENTATION=-